MQVLTQEEEYRHTFFSHFKPGLCMNTYVIECRLIASHDHEFININHVVIEACLCMNI